MGGVNLSPNVQVAFHSFTLQIRTQSGSCQTFYTIHLSKGIALFVWLSFFCPVSLGHGLHSHAPAELLLINWSPERL